MNNNENPQPGNTSTDYMDRLRQSVGSNRDTEGLGTMSLGSFSVGTVDAINGEDGKEVPEFVVTTHELKQLACYWIQERLELDFDWFLYQTTGSSEWRWSKYINRRLSRLAYLLGQEVMLSVQQDVVASFRNRKPTITDEDWRIFTTGSDQEQEALRGKISR
jgi:hypothetical protein